MDAFQVSGEKMETTSTATRLTYVNEVIHKRKTLSASYYNDLRTLPKGRKKIFIFLFFILFYLQQFALPTPKWRA